MKNRWTRIASALAAVIFLTSVNGCGSGLLTVAADTITTPMAINAIRPSTSTVIKRVGGTVEVTANVGQAVQTTLQAIGGTVTSQWLILSGSLPTGLSASSDGTVSGVPTNVGIWNFTVGASRTQEGTTPPANQKVAFTVLPAALSISTTSLSAGQVGVAYTTNLQVSGGTPGYTWSVSSGTLPAGLSLSKSGTITGTPTAAGTFNFAAAVYDAGAPTQRQTKTFAILIKAAPLSVSSTSLAAAQSGTAYSVALAANGGTPAYAWTIASGTLPAGLTLSASGIISGTPTAPGTTNFTVAVGDSGAPAQRQTAALSLTVASAYFDVTTASLPNGQIGAPYTAPLQATGGVPPYVWTMGYGSLPAGLSLNGSGSITGTPTVAGTSTFYVAVRDSGTPEQFRLKPLTIVVGASPLAITSTGLSNAQTGASYSAQLNATGGTPGYTWSIATGSLPAGLTLSASGMLSGTPGAAGSFNFTVAVADSGSPVQQQTAPMTMTVTRSALNLSSVSLAGGQVGAGYSAGFSASGGTLSYTWSIRSGSLPAGLTLAATTGIVSGTPTTAGTSAFTIAVTDSSTPAQVQSAATSLTITQTPQSSASGTTWYIRPDGGTRYSANNTNGQCNGKSDSAYPGTGTNQACAFKDVRSFWTDGSYCVDNSPTSSCWKWIGSGGDTYLIRGSIDTGVTYRIGQDGPNNGDSVGLHGNPYGSGAPLPPAGTASAHTRILGENYGSCTSQSARTQLHGGFGTSSVLNLAGASYVDVQCLDITDFSSCGRAAQSNGCHTAYPLDDYANTGISLSNQTTHTTLTDIRIHGMANSGMIGPTGDGVVMTDIAIIANAAAGWNADAGDGQTGNGSLLVQNFNISWNGCAEEYPIVDALPYQDCTDDQSGGGYGDGFGTATVPSVPGWQAHFDQGVASYNTQDGLDALHLTGAGSSMTITRVLAYGNMGQQIKVGGASGTAMNNVIFTNCNALRQSIPGTPAGYNSRLSDFCRAADEGILFTVGRGSTGHFDFNTVYSASATGIDIQCDQSAGACDSTALMDYRDNIFVGFVNDTVSGYPAGRGSGNYSNPIYLASFNPFTNPGSVFSNNVTYHPKTNWSCPATGFNESSGLCLDPLLTDESWHLYGFGNVTPLLNNAVRGAGAAVPGAVTDYTGATRNAVPTVGAYE